MRKSLKGVMEFVITWERKIAILRLEFVKLETSFLLERIIICRRFKNKKKPFLYFPLISRKIIVFHFKTLIIVEKS